MNSEQRPTLDLNTFFEDLNAGLYGKKFMRAIQDVALGVVTYGDKGKSGEVTLKFKVKRIGESNQVVVGHDMRYSKPTMRGKAYEDDHTETPMHVGVGGVLSLVPDTQERFEFGKNKTDA